MDMRHIIALVEGQKTPLFFVPIRFWEDKEPETGYLVKDGEDHVYAFHNGYGHNVYMQKTDTFLSRDEAVAEAERRNIAREVERQAEVDEMMARMRGTLPQEPKAPKNPTLAFVPDVGTIVEYGGLDSKYDTKVSTYRVSAWLKEATPPAPSKYDFITHLLYQTQQKVGPDKKRLQFCTREEAEYLSLTGVCGAIARISDVKVVGRVTWTEEQIADEREQALALVGEQIH